MEPVRTCVYLGCPSLVRKFLVIYVCTHHGSDAGTALSHSVCMLVCICSTRCRVQPHNGMQSIVKQVQDMPTCKSAWSLWWRSFMQITFTILAGIKSSLNRHSDEFDGETDTMQHHTLPSSDEQCWSELPWKHTCLELTPTTLGGQGSKTKRSHLVS